MMKIEFVTTPDVTGQGRVVVDGLFYGLPVEAVKVLSKALEKPKCLFETRSHSLFGPSFKYCSVHGHNCPNTD